MKRPFYVLGMLGFALVAACAQKPHYNATDISQVKWGGDFVLTGSAGKLISTADFRGKIVIIFFGYSHCPDICTPTMVQLAQLMQRLGPQSRQVQVLFVTVDPTHDTPVRLSRFLAQFNPDFIGMTGTPGEIDGVARDYKITHEDTTSAGAPAVIINHSGGVFVKDRSGKLRLYVAQGMSVQDMTHDIKLLLGN